MANEITDITETTGTAWPTPVQDGNGKLTQFPQPLSLGSGYTLKYDAWNRLVQVNNTTGGALVATYRYDGANRRVTNLVSSNTRHYYYSDKWQILEERLNTATTADKRFVWGMRYLDDLILRDQSSTRHYVLHDYFNVTAIVDTSGNVLERYGYDAFGAVRFMNASFGGASSSYTWETLYGAYRYDSDTGLYQVRNRYLHPKLGRWEKRDPTDEKSGPNLYAYVLNRSSNRVDYRGLASTGSRPGIGQPGYITPLPSHNPFQNCNPSQTAAAKKARADACNRINKCPGTNPDCDKTLLAALQARCQNPNGIQVECQDPNDDGCNKPNPKTGLYNCAYERNGHITLCDPGAFQCGNQSLECVLVHEIAHIDNKAGTPQDNANKMEKCTGCPPGPPHQQPGQPPALEN